MSRYAPNPAVIVCYIDLLNHGQHYVEMRYDDVPAWQSNNPNFTITNMFTKSSDILSRNEVLEDNFNTHHAAYGIPEDYLHKRFYSPNDGSVIELIGMDMSNRKYKYIFENIVTHKRHKATKHYVLNLTAV